MTAVFLFLAAFLACAVEMVEALSIVVAVGIVRGWRSPLAGVAAATIVLAALVAGLAPALRRVPIGALPLVAGGLVLTFGLQGLREAIVRVSGCSARQRAAAALREDRARPLPPRRARP